jgi:hypothetical protein
MTDPIRPSGPSVIDEDDRQTGGARKFFPANPNLKERGLSTKDTKDTKKRGERRAFVFLLRALRVLSG